MEQTSEVLSSDDIQNNAFIPHILPMNENSDISIAVYLPVWYPTRPQLPQDRNVTHLFEQVYKSILSHWNSYRSELAIEEKKDEQEYIVDEPVTPITPPTTTSFSSTRQRDVNIRSNLNENIRNYSTDRARRSSHPLPKNDERSRSYEPRPFGTQHASKVQISDRSRKLTTPIILPTSLITSYENLKSVNNEFQNSSFSSASSSSESNYYSVSTTTIIQDQDINLLTSMPVKENDQCNNNDSQSTDKTAKTSFLPIHRKRTISTSSRISQSTSFDAIDQFENSDGWIQTIMQENQLISSNKQDNQQTSFHSPKTTIDDIQTDQEDECQKIVKNLLIDEVSNCDQQASLQENVRVCPSIEQNILFSNFNNDNINSNCKNSSYLFDIDDNNVQQASTLLSTDDEDKLSVRTLTDSSLSPESSLSSFLASSSAIKNTNNNTEDYFERLTKSIEPILKKNILTNNINNNRQNKILEMLTPSSSLVASNSNFSDTNQIQNHDPNDDVFTDPIPKLQEKRVSFSPQIIRQPRESYVRSPSLPPTPPLSYHSNSSSPLFKQFTPLSSPAKNRTELSLTVPTTQSESINRKSIIIPKTRRPDFVKVLSDSCHCQICSYFDRRQLKTNINLENALYRFLESKDIATTIITYIKSQDYKIHSSNLTFDIDINLLKELRMPKGFLEWFYTVPKFSRALLSLVKNINEFYRHCPIILSYVFIIEFAIIKPICLMFYYINWFLRLDMNKRFQLTLGIPAYFKRKSNDDDEESSVSETELFFIKWHWSKVPILFEDYYSNSSIIAYYETDDYHNLRILFQSHEDDFQNNVGITKIEFDDLFEDYRTLYSIEHIKAYLTNVNSITITFNEQNNRIPSFIETNDNENNENYHLQLDDYDEKKCLQHNRKPLKLFNCLSHLLENIYSYYRSKTFPIKQYELVVPSIVNHSFELTRRDRNKNNNNNNNNYDTLQLANEIKTNQILKDRSTSPIQFCENNFNNKQLIGKNGLSKQYHHHNHHHFHHMNDLRSSTPNEGEIPLSELPPPIIPSTDEMDKSTEKNNQSNKQPRLFNSETFESINNKQPDSSDITLSNNVDSMRQHQQQQAQENISSITGGDDDINSTSLSLEKLSSSIVTTNEKDKIISKLSTPWKSQDNEIKQQQQQNIFETPIRDQNRMADENVINYITPQSISRHLSLSKDKITHSYNEQMNNINKDSKTKFYTRASSLTFDERNCNREKLNITITKDNTEINKQRPTYLLPPSSNNDRLITSCIYDSGSELSSSENGGFQNFTIETLNECCTLNEKIELNMNSKFSCTGEFWVEYKLSNENEKKFRQLTSHISFYGNNYIAPKSVKINEIIGIYFESRWRRGRVLPPNNRSSSIALYLVDYGRVIHVPLTEIRWLPVEFTKFPYKAIQCYFSEALRFNYSDTMRENFQKLLKCRTVRAQVYEKDGNKVGVLLMCQVKDGTMNIYRYLNAIEKRTSKFLSNADITSLFSCDLAENEDTNVNMWEQLEMSKGYPENFISSSPPPPSILVSREISQCLDNKKNGTNVDSSDSSEIQKQQGFCCVPRSSQIHKRRLPQEKRRLTFE
ncbi:unnamed protein product [Didymodactylos carnosus]|uniref:Tudor domain-containing protein n=1 Tax=Didymodactylos carnosus TaxID=1234261 RepID=A0A813QIL6_9BILA|nr:unnamed protein product [Didymodactylos carnosus]CAF0768617.1 unnamed protein product [Didymodactylos carnosus]CAF3503585.1 unnamed protein product [Didymodactylos carnosus]CAF3550438.1 unnamed protein product [Didymodactylos carnosus]